VCCFENETGMERMADDRWPMADLQKLSSAIRHLSSAIRSIGVLNISNSDSYFVPIYFFE
jgi:hypothetical protein